MAKEKKTLKDQYAAILKGRGVSLRDCKVLAFAFDAPRGPEKFHYDVMMSEPRLQYYIFDCWDERAQVVVSNDDFVIAAIERIALELGGSKTMAELR